jgi:cytoskeletal protein CcmA (bactofilin family)
MVRIRLVPSLVRCAAALLLALVGLTLAVPGSWAAEVRGGDDVGVAAGEVVDDDLYLAGDEIVVAGTVRGDVVVAARKVTVTGTVEGDLIAAAQTVVVEGTVGDDARLAGQALLVRDGARIADDLVTGGYSLQTEAGSTVGGDVLLGGFQAELAGDVDGGVTAGAEGLALAGRIGGDVEASVSASGPEAAPFAWAPAADVPLPVVPSGLTLTDDARLEGDLSYEGGQEADIAPGAQIAGETTYRQITVPEDQDTAPAGPLALLLIGLRRFVTLLAVGLLALWLLPRTVDGAATTLRTRPWLSLGWGVLAVAGAVAAVVAVLLVSILLAVLLGWLTLGALAAAVVATGVVLDIVLVLALVLGLTLLAPVVVGFMGGGLMLRDPVPTAFGKRVLALALGLLVYVLLRAVPFVGPVVGLVVALLGVGALVVWAWAGLTSARRRRAGRLPGPGPGQDAGPLPGPDRAAPGHQAPWSSGQNPAGPRPSDRGAAGQWQTGQAPAERGPQDQGQDDQHRPVPPPDTRP